LSQWAPVGRGPTVPCTGCIYGSYAPDELLVLALSAQHANQYRTKRW